MEEKWTEVRESRRSGCGYARGLGIFTAKRFRSVTSYRKLDFLRTPRNFKKAFVLLSHSGSEVLHELRAIRSDMPVVLSSGYGTEDVAERFTDFDRLEFLHKPYRPSELAGAVEEVLRTKRH